MPLAHFSNTVFSDYFSKMLDLITAFTDSKLVVLKTKIFYMYHNSGCNCMTSSLKWNLQHHEYYTEHQNLPLKTEFVFTACIGFQEK